MRFISEEQSSAVITHEMAYAAMREALLAAVDPASVSFPVVLGHGSDPLNRFTIKSAAGADIAGLKIGSFWPDNPAKGLPRHNSTILLIDQESGRIGTVIEAGKVNAYRTGAADAVAADRLARANASTLAVFGAGYQARYECAALARIRPIRTILIVARNAAKAEAFARELRAEGFDASAETAEAACKAADILVTATSSRAPLFAAEWVRPGTHIASMGSDATGKQELPPELFARARLFCDLVEQSRRIGEFQHAAPGLPVVAIGEVLSERHPGRSSPEDITIFDSSGLSLQDLFMARHLLNAVPIE